MDAIRARIESILRNLNANNPDDLRTAAAEIRLLAERNDAVALAVQVHVEFIRNESPKNKENAAAVLVLLCRAHQMYLVNAQGQGVMELLGDLLHHGTKIGKEKAADLLEIGRATRPED